MKFWFISLTLLSFNSLASSSRFECKYLDYSLELKTSGSKPIVHDLRVNGKISITELYQGSWFIESVNCKQSGYEIVASHVQYNDATKKVFRLTYNAKTGYKIK